MFIIVSCVYEQYGV